MMAARWLELQVKLVPLFACKHTHMLVMGIRDPSVSNYIPIISYKGWTSMLKAKSTDTVCYECTGPSTNLVRH